MKKDFAAVVFACLCSIFTIAQERNPLINSGEIIKEAINLYDSGKYKDALVLYKKVSRNDTNYVRALYETALTYAADSQFNAAIQACEQAMAGKSDPEQLPNILTEYGSLMDNIGQPEKSLHIFDSALQLYPTHSFLYLNKGTTLLTAKRYAEAEAAFKQCILQDPYNASSHFKLGIAAMQNGKLVPAMLCFMNYLVISPAGRYSNNCVSILSSIAQNRDEIKSYVENRKEDPAEEYALPEQIIQSKIALDKNYKPIIELDDAISRQIQVLLEKLSYAADSKDFWMQYYVPYFKDVFSTGKFEQLINYMFSNVNVAQIQNYNKKNKKEIQALIDQTVVYFNKIRATRELNYAARNSKENKYFFENNQFSGIGLLNAKGDKFINDWTFYFASGNIKSKGRFNDNGEKDGEWTYYYFDGNLKAKQHFIAGKLDGMETFYFQNGHLSSETNYKNDKQEGQETTYYYAGGKKSIALYSNGKVNGSNDQFYANGNLRLSQSYKDGKLDGRYSSWYKNGNPEAEAVYAEGLLEGYYKAWYSNGNLAAEGAYSKDKPVGLWKKYHESGPLKSQYSFVNGKEEGEYTEQYDNGALFTKYVYRKGAISGPVTYNDDDSKPFAVLNFDDSKIQQAKYFDKTGKEISSSVAKDKKIDLLSFYADGNKRMQVSYNAKGNSDGKEINFYHCGKVSQTNDYVNGELNGKSVNYFLNEKISNETPYKEDKKDGYYKSYYANSQLESEGWYAGDEAQGKWLYYDERGNLTSTQYFNDGELNGHKEVYYENGRVEFDTRYHFGWMEEMTQYDTTGKEINHITINQGNGLYRGVHLNGKTRFEVNFVNGYFEGPYKLYFFDGSPQVIQFYKRGEPDSIYRSYYYGGKINTEGQYKLGVKTGVWKFYGKDGKLSNIAEYIDDEFAGHHVYYNSAGKVDLDIQYKSGNRNGPTKKYEPGGNLVYQINYKNDLPVSYTYFGKDNQLVADIPLQGGSGKIKTWYPNGQLATEHSYTEGKIQGAYRLYYPNGKIWQEREDSFDITSGAMKEFYENGQLKSNIQYLDNNPHGPYKEFNAKGIVTEESNFYNGNYHGESKLYDDNGRPVATRIYYYGQLLTEKK